MKIVFYFITFLCSVSVWAQVPDLVEHCHQVEGVRLHGCSPQAKPLECGPPKVCPPVIFTDLPCSSYMVSVTQGGICDSYGVPVCHQVGDQTICDPAPCLHYTQPSCHLDQITCGRNPISIPCQPATPDPYAGTPVPDCFYDCHINHCHATPPPGKGACGVECQQDQSCNVH